MSLQVKDFRGKHIVVLGGAGFLGSHLCDRLLAEGAARVVSLDNYCTGHSRNHVDALKDDRFGAVTQDITASFDVPGPVDFVFNMASPASPIDYAQLWLETMRVGSVGTENALLLAERKKAVFLQASTSEIYGDPLVSPQYEDYCGNVDPTGPRAVYDEAKRYAEALVSAFRRSKRVSTRIVRIFNTYGPRMRLNDGRVVPAFVGQALAGQDFTIFGDGLQTRSFCYVSDLIEGIVRLAATDLQEPINIGNPREMTMLEFAESVRRTAGGGGKLTFMPLPKGDPKQRRPDISKARQLLQWEPKVSLEDGLQKTIHYFRTVVQDARSN